MVDRERNRTDQLSLKVNKHRKVRPNQSFGKKQTERLTNAITYYKYDIIPEGYLHSKYRRY